MKKMLKPYGKAVLPMLVAITAFSCSDEIYQQTEDTGGLPIKLTGRIRQQNQTRANEQGFVTGDRMGIYIVDYDNDAPGSLNGSNRASNVLYTFDGEEYEWTAPLQLYWRDARTPVDVYGYYPGVNSISDPAAYPFEVSWQQNAEPREGEMSNYEASDLLWGKAEHIMPSMQEIVVNYTHQLSGVFVTLQKGEGVSDIEWDKLDKIVQADNTTRTCNFNLQTAAITPTGNPDRSIQMLPQSGSAYRAVVIPQTIEAGKSLISITLDGKTYSHKLSEPMKYVGGKMHNFTITVNKSDADGEYTISVADGGITDWVNDEGSHNFKQNQYVIINCPEPGKLKESIAAAGYDYQEMQNLKVTGKLNHNDVWFMRDEMSNLKHLNMADALMRGCCFTPTSFYGGYPYTEDQIMDDVMPTASFYKNNTIRSLVLPNRLKHIGSSAFREMKLMSSTFIIPEGVTKLDNYAFMDNEYNGVELILPNSIDSIGEHAFFNCSYSCEINLTDNITYIGEGAFGTQNWFKPSNMHGVFHVPAKLKEINNAIFEYLGNDGSITGEIEIPQGIETIGDHAFSGIAFQNRISISFPQGLKVIRPAAFAGKALSALQFNDDLEEIQGGGWEGGAFYDASIPFPITLPSQLRTLGAEAFYRCGLEGELIIPENCIILGNSALKENNLTNIVFPSTLEYIPENFACGNLYTSITIPKYVSYLGKGALACPYLQTIVCLAETPPEINDGDPFQGVIGWDDINVYKDKCVLEVPEKSVELYRNTPGWSSFKNITPHRELAYNVSSITCMEKGTTREGILRSQGPWEVVECPSWVTVSPSSSNSKKTEVKITVNSNNGGTREGKVVFKLKGYDYTTYTDVRQVRADVKEEQMFTLQTATKGSRAVPIFIVGEGYDADDIASGKYLTEVKEQMEHIFSIEPMKTYRDYFTVSTAVACSPESGIDGLRKFHNDEYWIKSDDDMVLEYAQKYGIGIKGNESNAMIVVLRNTNNTGANGTTLYEYEHRGLSISWIGKSDETYPFNQQGFVLHEAVGIGFGKLGPEYINHFTFIQSCICPYCKMLCNYANIRSLGWWQNVSTSGKLTELPWYHLVFDEKYAQMVDVWEGGINHSRGAYRSENQSVMGNRYIPYFNAISREIIVKRIMEASGGTFDFETFKANDKIEFPE